MKERIAAAAVQEMKSRGLKFAIRDVTSRLGISTKTLYQYFDSKEHLITWIIQQSIQEMKDTERQIMNDPSLTLIQKLKQALIVLPSAFAFTDIRTLDELKRSYPEQWRLVDAYINEGWDHIRELVDTGIQAQMIRPLDMELFIRIYVGAVYQLMDRGGADERHLPLDTALTRTVELLLYGIVLERCRGPMERRCG
ncbi:TetR/AcrR family transcriptional regulator [Paenibacillus dendritiformis]|uniref:TetR/AcrR family transcriptional regulator n=1 Tax=Paenibacillus dendritiformis TaxID=130049 RepID=UPI0018CD8AA6|nr:TetR/AcrR family transcriptional regulator [Paenibacillus dendritiformis]